MRGSLRTWVHWWKRSEASSTRAVRVAANASVRLEAVGTRVFPKDAGSTVDSSLRVASIAQLPSATIIQRQLPELTVDPTFLSLCRKYGIAPGLPTPSSDRDGGSARLQGHADWVLSHGWPKGKPHASLPNSREWRRTVRSGGTHLACRDHCPQLGPDSGLNGSWTLHLEPASGHRILRHVGPIHSHTVGSLRSASSAHLSTCSVGAGKTPPTPSFRASVLSSLPHGPTANGSLLRDWSVQFHSLSESAGSCKRAGEREQPYGACEAAKAAGPETRSGGGESRGEGGATGGKGEKACPSGWTYKEVVNWPNAISMARLLSGPPIAMLIVHDELGMAVALLSAAAVSDWLDGYVARRSGVQTVLGTYLDPLADKVLIACVSLAMVAHNLLPLWLVGLVLARDIALLAGSFVQRAHALQWRWRGVKEFFNISPGGAEKMQPLFVSKVNTVAQLALVASALLLPAFGISDDYNLVPQLGYLVAFTTMLSGGAYAAVHVSRLRASPRLPLRPYELERFKARPLHRQRKLGEPS